MSRQHSGAASEASAADETSEDELNLLAAGVDIDGDHADTDKKVDNGEKDGEKEKYDTERHSRTRTSRGDKAIHVDSFECILLHSILARLEQVIARFNSTSASSSDAKHTAASPSLSRLRVSQDERDCFHLLSYLLLSSSSVR